VKVKMSCNEPACGDGPARATFLDPSIGGDELLDPIGRTLLC
jgi:hypothetical protein